MAPPCQAEEVGYTSRMTAPVSILDKKSDYHGPEREEPEPVVEEVRIGFFAPHEAGNLPGQSLWRGAMAAIEEANANEGYHGKPFRLVCRWADNPWGAGSREMTRLVYEDKVWAVIGSIDGAGTHIAEQVATKARITLVSPLSGDPSLTHTAVPWMFRLPPDDSAVAEALVRLAVEKMGHRRIVVLSSTDHDGRRGGAEISRALRRRSIAPVLHMSLDANQTDFTQHLSRIASMPADAIFLWGPRDPSVRFLLAMREQSVNRPVFGPIAFSLPSFLQRAKGAAEGLTTCRLVWAPNDSRWAKFAEEYRSRFGENPTDDAALGYDAASMLIEAIGKAGLNRARIRDSVAEMSGFIGLAGKVRWDNGGGNIVSPLPVVFRGGELRGIED
jgi:ABC-type branched-subunit amino acid transport system substrate-binding protein